ncbi:TonB-dependent receptor [Altericroceibacterium spongiae]|uniref:TonB-dependent receptor n=1 Tax=Altericroceibacterium spongiae TaxID=2320269 RepID=A0A420EEA5_9SPHN|nr:TonB-dependent receptor [Altericroceibacterium spongiae]RKF19000.1 TonB-dependent receptor [Altericroceibacterium spongiae]
MTYSKNIALRSGAASLALGVALIATPVFAQSSQSDVDQCKQDESGQCLSDRELATDSTGSDEGLIIVTGSRIASSTITSEAPLQVLTGETLADAGSVNVQETLLENPVFGTPALSRTNSAFLTSGTGVTSIDLRDLGSNRTLVLIDGRRVVASVPGSQTVDLNVMPTQFIDRIDVLTGGASSLYGSDAVAGVVNIVYKKNFEGITANAQYGATEEGDSDRYQANVTVGSNFADNSGNIMVHFGYSKEDGLLSRDRKGTQTDAFSLGRLNGNISDLYTEYTPYYSSYPTQGRFIVDGGDTQFTYSPDGNLQDCFTTNGDSCGTDGVGPNGFNRQNYRTLAVPVKRYLFATRGNYELNDNLSFIFEGTYNKTTSSRIIEPFALSSDGSTGVYPDSGVMPIENYVVQNGVASIVSNPLVPSAIAAAATDTDGDGLRDIGFARRLLEFGNRTGSTDRDFYRFVVGFEGEILDDRFHWDASYNYGRVDESQRSSGQVNVANFRNALAVMQDVNDVDGDGATDDMVCINAEARANGCVPANIFGAGNISDDAVAYIQAPSSLQTKLEQQVLQANVSGSLFDLPAGSVGLATGVEYRKESSNEDWDALTNQGLNAGNLLPDTSGSFDVLEGYMELRVPIIADQPFFKLLEVGGAVRVADYSTVGTTTSYNVTGTWQPIDDLRFRGTFARAVRAPNIGELYAGMSQTFPSGLTDPCVGVGASGGGAIGDNCRAAAGVSENIAQNGSFVASQSDLQGISGFNGGNPDLHEETADSWTIGAVVNPRSIYALRNLTLTIDYYNIKIDDVIASFPRQFILDQCYGQGTSNFCDLIIRRPSATATNSAGSIEYINALDVNAAQMKTDGIDFTLNYQMPVGITSGDQLTLSGSYTHVFKNDYYPIQGGEDVDRSAGEIGTAKDRFTTKGVYSNDDFRWSMTGTFIGRSYEDDQLCSSLGANPKCIGVSSQFYLDTQVSYEFIEGFQIYFGIDNLLDNNAPLIPSGTTFNVTGANTAADVYDIFGRRYYGGVRLNF